jgi:hypothetical protein
MARGKIFQDGSGPLDDMPVVDNIKVIKEFLSGAGGDYSELADAVNALNKASKDKGKKTTKMIRGFGAKQGGFWASSDRLKDLLLNAEPDAAKKLLRTLFDTNKWIIWDGGYCPQKEVLIKLIENKKTQALLESVYHEKGTDKGIIAKINGLFKEALKDLEKNNKSTSYLEPEKEKETRNQLEKELETAYNFLKKIGKDPDKTMFVKALIDSKIKAIDEDNLSFEELEEKSLFLQKELTLVTEEESTKVKNAVVNSVIKRLEIAFPREGGRYTKVSSLKFLFSALTDEKLKESFEQSREFCNLMPVFIKWSIENWPNKKDVIKLINQHSTDQNIRSITCKTVANLEKDFEVIFKAIEDREIKQDIVDSLLASKNSGLKHEKNLKVVLESFRRDPIKDQHSTKQSQLVEERIKELKSKRQIGLVEKLMDKISSFIDWVKKSRTTEQKPIIVSGGGVPNPSKRRNKKHYQKPVEEGVKEVVRILKEGKGGAKNLERQKTKGRTQNNGVGGL